MSRQWYIVKEVIEDADIILEVLDARDPEGTRNKQIERLILAEKNAKLILVLNKIDLVPKDVVDKWQTHLSNVYPTIKISATYGFERSLRFLRKQIEQFASKYPVTVGIVGYSNVGKSTIINGLKGSKIVGVSPQAGYTRGKQYINLGKNIRLIDSPGIIPFEGNEVELALKAAITPEKIQNVDAVVMEIINRVGIERLSQIYKIEITTQDGFLAQLARRRGKLLPRGEPDLYEAAKIVIRDWQRGNVGFYSLPPSE